MGVVWLPLAQDINKWHALRMRKMVWLVGWLAVKGGGLLSREDTVLGSQEKPNVDALFPFTGTVTGHIIG
jgi:hypothetical protein